MTDLLHKERFFEQIDQAISQGYSVSDGLFIDQSTPGALLADASSYKYPANTVTTNGFKRGRYETNALLLKLIHDGSAQTMPEQTATLASELQRNIRDYGRTAKIKELSDWLCNGVFINYLSPDEEGDVAEIPSHVDNPLYKSLLIAVSLGNGALKLDNSDEPLETRLGSVEIFVGNNLASSGITAPQIGHSVSATSERYSQLFTHFQYNMKKDFISVVKRILP